MYHFICQCLQLRAIGAIWLNSGRYNGNEYLLSGIASSLMNILCFRGHMFRRLIQAVW